MPATLVNPDLAKERQKCTFKPTELTYFLDGGEKNTKERKEREEIFLSDPNLKDEIPNEYLSHKEKYENAIKKASYLMKKVMSMRGDVQTFRHLLGGQLGSALIKDGSPITLHYVMFVPTILGQATIEQQAFWLGRAWNCEIIGTYAQTELGHGTFIRGLETTAHYDPESEEFILNSPTLTAYKWWPGGLGHTANYAVVVAQLYTKGKCHGIHPFIVQLRDEETHMPLKGIKIGEIGSKLGMNSTNNGYLGFENVRIPRTNLLMKNAQVLEDGTYIKGKNEKLTYGTMMFVRVCLINDMANYLSIAVTIAARYSAVRRQSELIPQKGETQILDYRTQQYKIIPNIATCLAFRFTASWLWDIYNEVSAELEAGDLDQLPELHALSCCLKAVCTADAAHGVEVCRLACGGHGYMTCSNLPNTYGLATAACTYEGENTVLLLQTARFLIKAWNLALSKQPMTPTMLYLKESIKYLDTKMWNPTMENVTIAFQQVATGKIKTAYDNMNRRIKNGIDPNEAWNATSIELVQASEAHCRAIIVEKFHHTIKEAQLSSPLREVLLQLCELYGLYWLLHKTGDFLMYSNMKSSDINECQHWLENLLMKLRPNTVGLVDGFDNCDDILGSPLGAWDGRVYERLFKEAQKSPLNQEPVNSSFHKYLKPLMKSNL